MDPLSQIIGLLKPQAVFWRVVEAHNAWTIGFRPTNIVVFGQVIEGACRVEREDGISLDLEAGDFLLMAAPPNWTMAAFVGEPLQSTSELWLKIRASCFRPSARIKSHVSWRATSRSQLPIAI